MTAWLQEREEGGEAAAKRKRRAAGLDEEDELYLQGSDSEDEMYDRWADPAVHIGLYFRCASGQIPQYKYRSCRHTPSYKTQRQRGWIQADQ